MLINGIPISEGLRKYPIQTATDRICNKPYVLKPDGDEPVHIPEGTTILIPTYCLHHDPKLFPNPKKFDPERFNNERKTEIKSYAYQPFGLGRRSCIATKFALMEIKMGFFHLLSKFELVPAQSTKIPLVLMKNPFAFTSENGFWFDLKKL